MSLCDRWWLRGLACLCVLASSSVLADPPFNSRFFNEPAIIFNHASWLEGQLPGLIHNSHFPVVSRNEIDLRCLTLKGKTVRARQNALLVYFPQSQTCLALDDMRLSQRHQRTTGMNRTPGFETEYQQLQIRLQTQALVIIQPQAATPVAGVCSCDGNAPPDVEVDSGPTGPLKTGDPVLIQFSFSDADSGVLTPFFSYTLDGGPRQEGLPTGLTPECTQGTEVLTCTITGNAPMPGGLYVIQLEVTDNLSSGFANAFLDVLRETILTNGFETNP